MDRLLMDIRAMNNLDRQIQSRICNLHFFRCPKHCHKLHPSLVYQRNPHSPCLRLVLQIESLLYYHQRCENNRQQVVFVFDKHHGRCNHLGKPNAGKLHLHIQLRNYKSQTCGHRSPCWSTLRDLRQKHDRY